MTLTLRPQLAAIIGAVLLLGACAQEHAPLAPLDQIKYDLAHGDPVGAEVRLNRLLEQGEPVQNLAAYMGEAKLAQGDRATARSWLTQHGFSDATRAHGFYILGQLEMAEMRLPEAGQAFDQSFNNGGENADLWVAVARLRFLGGEHAQAIDAGNKAVSLDPSDVDAIILRGQFARDSKGDEAALEWFNKGTVFAPDDTRLLIEIARSQGELGQAHAMLDTVRKIAKIDPSNLEILYLQAVLAARAGNFDLANTLLVRSRKAEGAIPSAMLLSAIIDLERGNYASAATTLFRLKTKQPQNRRIPLLLARALAMGDSPAELSTSVDANAASPYVHSILAHVYAGKGDFAQAALHTDLATQAQPPAIAPILADSALASSVGALSVDGGEVAIYLRAAISGKDFGRGRAIAGSFLQRHPTSLFAQTLAGDAALAAGKNADAIRLYRAASITRRSWALSFKTSVAMLRSAQRDAAYRELADYARKNPYNLESAAMLLDLAVQRQDWHSARTWGEKALNLGGRQDAQLAAQYARSLLMVGEGELALRYAKLAHEIQPMNANAARILSDCLDKLGKGGDLARLARIKAEMLTKNAPQSKPRPQSAVFQ